MRHSFCHTLGPCTVPAKHTARKQSKEHGNSFLSLFQLKVDCTRAIRGLLTVVCREPRIKEAALRRTGDGALADHGSTDQWINGSAILLLSYSLNPGPYHVWRVKGRPL